MLVWPGGQSGTIGGGALEFQAAEAARALLITGLDTGGHKVARVPLGPALGQCCGGAVTLLTETFDEATLPRPVAGVVARATDDRAMPMAVARLMDQARGQGVMPAPQFLQGWFVEPVTEPTRQLWIWGAGHVGRALVAVLAPMPDVGITWVDVAAERYPEAVPDGVIVLPAAAPAALVSRAPSSAEHIVLTYSHALDLDLCHRLLTHGFTRCGLIGSATKWARFRSRLAALGHDKAEIARIECPIGDPGLGKHPQAIAVGVAAAFLRRSGATQERATG